MSHAQSSAVELASLLNDSLAPIYVLDDGRRIVFCNQACARWIGLDAAELLNQQCNYCSESDDRSPASIAAGLCPPPKVFCGLPRAAIVSCPTGDGQSVHRRGHFFPLSDGADESAPVVAVLEMVDCSAAEADPNDPDAPDAAATLHEQLRAVRGRLAERFRVDRLLGESPSMRRARAQIELAADSRANVLIVGADGTGKDHVAKTIHYAQINPGDLLPVACNVLDENVLRTALRSIGSPAVGSQQRRATLLLNDVDQLPVAAQSDLATLLGQAPTARILATASQPLKEVTGEAELSQEVACALSTITIELVPLCRRLDDLPILVQALLEDENRQSNKQVGGITSDALDRLAAYPWPGNLDELATVVRQAHQSATAGEVRAGDLPRQVQWAAQAGAHPPKKDEVIVLEDFLAGIEKELIGRALRRAKNNKSKAAKMLGLTRPRLYRRLVQLGLEQIEEDDLN